MTHSFEPMEETKDTEGPTPEITDKILVALRSGVMRYAAACIGGISPETMSHWLSSKTPECRAFRKEVIRTERVFESIALIGMAKAGKKDWRAYSALLRYRRFAARGQLPDFDVKRLDTLTLQRLIEFGEDAMLEEDLYPSLRKEEGSGGPLKDPQ